VLYTSVEQDCALAEVASFLAELTPRPRAAAIKVSRIAITASNVVTLGYDSLEKLGVDIDRYGERDYQKTQEIGSALEYLGADGLIAPSARWPANNLMIFTKNHGLTERLELIDDLQVEWRSWARNHGLLDTNQ
jgi:hypothetical protein